MSDETIIACWKRGNSKEWLFQQKYEALQWDKKNNPKTIYKGYKAAELKYAAKQYVEELLYKWYMKEILGR